MDLPFKRIYYLDGTPEEIWEAFLIENNIEKWLASESQMSHRTGYEFYWKVDGERMTGRVGGLVLYKELNFEWKRQQWPEGTFAKVEIDLNQMDDKTRVEIKITDIPEDEGGEVYEDWNDEIIPRLEEYLEGLRSQKKAA